METLSQLPSHVSTWWMDLTGPALEALRLALTPFEAAMVALTALSWLVSLAYARRHRTGRCHSPAEMCARQAREADAARQVTR